MPDGYRFVPQPNDVADFILGKSTWAVLALTCHIEIFTQVHYRQSIEPDQQLSPLYKDVFFFHWKEESQHAIIDELEWQRENARLSTCERDAAVDDLIALVAGIDGMLQQQAKADVELLRRHLRPRSRCGRNVAHPCRSTGRVPLAIHRFGRPRAAFRRHAGRHAQRAPATARLRGTGADRPIGTCNSASDPRRADVCVHDVHNTI